MLNLFPNQVLRDNLRIEMFNNAIFNLLLLVAEIGILYTVGRQVNQYLVYLILNAKPATARMLHILYAPGVTLHETSHAIVALVFGARIDKFVPYHPQVEEEAGGLRMGYVEYSMRSHNPISGFLIGIAPLVGVPLILFGLAEIMVPGAAFNHGLISVLEGVVHNLANPFSISGLLSIAFLYLLLSGSLGLLPSVSDHRDLIPFTVIVAVIIGGIYIAGGNPNFSFMNPVISFLGQLLLPPAIVTVVLLDFVRSATATRRSPKQRR